MFDGMAHSNTGMEERLSAVSEVTAYYDGLTIGMAAAACVAALWILSLLWLRRKTAEEFEQLTQTCADYTDGVRKKLKAQNEALLVGWRASHIGWEKTWAAYDE